MSRGDWIWRGLLVAAILGIIFGSMLVTDAVTVSKNHCIDQGIPADKLVLDEFKLNGRWFGRTASVRWGIKGEPKGSASVELRQTTSFLPWHVTKFDRQAQEPGD